MLPNDKAKDDLIARNLQELAKKRQSGKAIADQACNTSQETAALFGHAPRSVPLVDPASEDEVAVAKSGPCRGGE